MDFEQISATELQEVIAKNQYEMKLLEEARSKVSERSNAWRASETALNRRIDQKRREVNDLKGTYLWTTCFNESHTWKEVVRDFENLNEMAKKLQNKKITIHDMDSFIRDLVEMRRNCFRAIKELETKKEKYMPLQVLFYKIEGELHNMTEEEKKSYNYVIS